MNAMKTFDKFNAYRPKSADEIAAGVVLHFRKGDVLWRVERVEGGYAYLILLDDEPDGFFPVGTKGRERIADCLSDGRIVPHDVAGGPTPM